MLPQLGCVVVLLLPDVVVVIVVLWCGRVWPGERGGGLLKIDGH